MNIFNDDQDFRIFLNRLKENLFPNLENSPEDAHQGRSHTHYVRKKLPEGSFSLVTYCLMLNHFHLLIKQDKDIPISKLVSKVCTSYSKYFNKKYERVGALFQDQFKYSHVDNNEYLLWLSAYIHLNPMVIGINDWKWSSYPEYLGKESKCLCKREIITDQMGSVGKYEEFVNTSLRPILSRKKDVVFDLADAEFESP